MASLDGIRGMAVMIVFLSHAGNKGMVLPGGFSPAGIGKSGVYLFFVLSSFLITTILLASRERLKTTELYANFFARRFFRVYPLFVLYVLCALITTPLSVRIFGSTDFAAPFPLDFVGALQHLALVRGDGVSWSIPVEMKYYFVSPLMVIALLGIAWRWGGWIAAVVGLSFAGAWAVAVVALPFIEAPGSKTVQLVAFLPSFIVGATLALMRSDVMPEGALSRGIGAQRAVGWLALAVTVAMTPEIYNAITGHDVGFNYFHDYVFTYALLWALLINASLSGDKVLNAVFTFSLLRFIGLVSFSYYLSHPIFLELAVRAIGPVSPFLAILVAFGVTLLFSYLSYRFFEKPVLAAGSNWVAGKFPRQEAA